VLVIASDIRQLEHIEYTPAPDIIHEGAGHAPIIANLNMQNTYAVLRDRLQSNFFTKDYEMYEAIRLLSEKKAPQATIDAEKQSRIYKIIYELSEMAQIRNLHWWTVEYGLIGTVENPKIYGAGLLSSIGESALHDSEVTKILMIFRLLHKILILLNSNRSCMLHAYICVFEFVLEEFANKMALRTGGLSELKTDRL
jgi:phenylalanine-4-hydroxylase